MSEKVPEDNLGKRQKALNAKVNQAVVNKVDFNNIKETSEASDLDHLFKIDVAAKYLNTDYIIDVLKSGDSFYVTRALNKSVWLYDEDHIHIINPDFLHKNVFPFMSNKMKKKLLTAVSKNARTEKRAIEFYHYCMKMKLTNIAFKFLLFTGEEFKRNLMLHHNEAPFNEIINKDLDYIKHLIGRSFRLLEAFLTMLPKKRHDLILKLKYMYTVCNNTYVHFLEKYIIVRNLGYRLDLKLSNDIMTKHKERVLANPSFFEPLVNYETFLKHSTADDAKIYAVALLPNTSAEFWNFFYRRYERILKKIPHEEMYSFIQKIFYDKYPESEFEMTYDFYSQNFHQFMTLKEKEDWAWRHIKNEKQILGIGCDYLWYEYVSFEPAFEVVKKMILVTKEPEKRLDMLNVLVKSAKNIQELEKLFIYYEKRHSNELRPNHVSFLKTVITRHNVFEFDEACWVAFYKLLLNMELYNVLDFKDCNQIYKTVTLLYYIVHKLPMNPGLTEYLLFNFETKYIIEHLSKLNGERHEVIYCYLFQYYIDQINEFKDKIFTPDESTRVRRYYHNITFLLSKFRASTSKLVRVKKRVYNQPRKTRRLNNSLSDRELIRRLKTDTDLIIDLVSELKKQFTDSYLKVPNFLKKLKIYFSEDVAKTYLELFEDLVSKDNRLQTIDSGVFGIFQLADDKRKIDFMNEHIPQDSKINCDTIVPSELRIQKAICHFVCYSRPPLPLASVLMYLKGDYVKFCISIFDTYHAHLPIQMCVQFVESIIDSPVSLQKHGIRLAFKCLNTETLKNTISKIWKKTKNVSLRGIIYKTLYKKLETQGDVELFDALKSFTSTLHQDDEEEIFDLISNSALPNEYRGHYYEVLWSTVGKFKNIQPNINRKIEVINKMNFDINLLNEKFVRMVVYEHIDSMLIQKNLHLHYSTEDISRLCVVKWKLIARYIIQFAAAETDTDKYSKVAEDIIGKCVESWNEESHSINHFQALCFDFIGFLKKESCVISYEDQNYETVIPVFENILNTLIKGLLLPDIYMLMWDLRLTIISRRVIQVEKSNQNDSKERIEIISRICTNLGIEVGKLIIEFIKNKTYFVSFLSNIVDAITKAVKYVFSSLNNFSITYLQTALMFVASGLVEHELPETFIIATKLLPDSDSPEYKTDVYSDIIKKINSFSDFEVQSAMYARKCCKRKRDAIEQSPPQEKHATKLRRPIRRSQPRRRWVSARKKRF